MERYVSLTDMVKVINDILFEKEYQKFILNYLETKKNGYTVRKNADFDRLFAVDRGMLFKFLEETQPDTVADLRKVYKSNIVNDKIKKRAMLSFYEVWLFYNVIIRNVLT